MLRRIESRNSDIAHTFGRRQQTRTAIGLLSAMMLPLVLKFLWAPWVDRLRPIPGMHRAGWVLITQSLTVLVVAAFSLVAPTDIWAFFALGMALALLVSTQDIAADGYATRRLAPADRPFGNAIQGGSVALGAPFRQSRRATTSVAQSLRLLRRDRRPQAPATTLPRPDLSACSKRSSGGAISVTRSRRCALLPSGSSTISRGSRRAVQA